MFHIFQKLHNFRDSKQHVSWLKNHSSKSFRIFFSVNHYSDYANTPDLVYIYGLRNSGKWRMGHRRYHIPYIWKYSIIRLAEKGIQPKKNSKTFGTMIFQSRNMLFWIPEVLQFLKNVEHGFLALFQNGRQSPWSNHRIWTRHVILLV